MTIDENSGFSEREAARKRGKQIGRPFALDKDTILKTHTIATQNNIPITAIAEKFGVSHMTLYRGFKRYGVGAV